MTLRLHCRAARTAVLLSVAGCFQISAGLSLLDSRLSSRKSSKRSFQHVSDAQAPDKLESDWGETMSNDSPYGWVRTAAAEDSPLYYHVHIPKTAGVSFLRDILSILPDDAGLFSWEACYSEMTGMVEQHSNGTGPHRMITMLRKPSEHVYSEYLECADTPWGKAIRSESGAEEEDVASFTSWLQHFAQNSTDDFNCYHPFNMQSRALSCDYPSDPHHYDGELNSAMTAAAFRAMEETFFVGLVEYYQESLCLFHSKVVESALPSWCDCKQKGAWNAKAVTNATHNVPEHSLHDLSSADMDIVNSLTEHDQMLYNAAYERFKKDIAAEEEKRGVKIMCSTP